VPKPVIYDKRRKYNMADDYGREGLSTASAAVCHLADVFGNIFELNHSLHGFQKCGCYAEWSHRKGNFSLVLFKKYARTTDDFRALWETCLSRSNNKRTSLSLSWSFLLLRFKRTLLADDVLRPILYLYRGMIKLSCVI
jgi:hypothetical protein